MATRKTKLSITQLGTQAIIDSDDRWYSRHRSDDFESDDARSRRHAIAVIARLKHAGYTFTQMLSEIEKEELRIELEPGRMNTSPLLPVPGGVYFNSDTQNFYSVIDRIGMGEEFFRLWKHRKAEFPTYEAICAEHGITPEPQPMEPVVGSAPRRFGVKS